MTATADSKFGIPLHRAADAAEICRRLALDVVGVHEHAGKTTRYNFFVCNFCFGLFFTELPVVPFLTQWFFCDFFLFVSVCVCARARPRVYRERYRHAVDVRGCSDETR